MKNLRRTLFGLGLITLLFGVAYSQQTGSTKTQAGTDAEKLIIISARCHRKPRIVPPNNDPLVIDLRLSKAELIAGASDADLKIDVSVYAFDADDDVLTYNYVPTGGKITGHGKEVVWDLSGVKPGIYTLTVGADDGCGVCGNTLTREVKIVE